MKVLLTGASGFVGRELVSELSARNFDWRAAVREPKTDLDRSRQIVVGDLSAKADWSEALAGADAVIHLAGRAHQLQRGDEHLFREVNSVATEKLCAAARRAGVKKFIFLSTIKVLGSTSRAGLEEDTEPRPEDPYSVSKAEAENAVRDAFSSVDSGQYFILRPPLVYGPRAKGYFHKILRACASRFPLPLTGIRDNRRSLVYVKNLTDAILTCLSSTQRRSHLFHVADTDPVSTGDLVLRLSRQFPDARRLAISPWLLDAGLRALRRGEDRKRLFSDLVVSTERIRRELGWTAPFSIDEGLRLTAKDYIELNRSGLSCL